MKWFWITLFIMSATQASAREVWADGDFKLHTAGWVDQEIFPQWLGVKCLMTIPEGGWFLLEGPGALELYFPKSGWRKDVGIIVMHGCNPDPVAGRDSAGGACGLNREFACKKHGDRVMMIVRVRRFNPTSDNRPTRARWVRGEMNYGVSN